MGIWLGELARELKDGTYVPQAVRQVLIRRSNPASSGPGHTLHPRPGSADSGTASAGGRLSKRTLQQEQHAYRPGRSANDAVNRVHSLLNSGRNEVVDGRSVELLLARFRMPNCCGAWPGA